jgi:hypothetical protein
MPFKQGAHHTICYRNRTLSAQYFPCLDITLHHPEQLVRLRLRHRFDALQCLRFAQFKFGAQVRQFIIHLSARNRHFDTLCAAADFRVIEAVTTPFRLSSHFARICRNGSRRIGLVAKALQLRMMAIASGLSGQYFLRKQSFTPQRNQPLGIEVSRV